MQKLKEEAAILKQKKKAEDEYKKSLIDLTKQDRKDFWEQRKMEEERERAFKEEKKTQESTKIDEENQDTP